MFETNKTKKDHPKPRIIASVWISTGVMDNPNKIKVYFRFRFLGRLYKKKIFDIYVQNEVRIYLIRTFDRHNGLLEFAIST